MMNNTLETLAKLEAKIDSLSEVVKLMNATGFGKQPTQQTELSLPNGVLESLGPNRTIFHALKTEKSGNSFAFSGDIKFDELPINVDNGFNAQNGIFVAPRTGYFVFSLSGMTMKSGTDTTISVLKNGNLNFKITEGESKHNHDNVAYSWMEPMTTGDTLKLVVTQGKLYAFSHNSELIHFSGYSLVRYSIQFCIIDTYSST